MTERKLKTNIYSPCRDVKRAAPDSIVDEELMKEIARNYRTLPSFENTLFDRKIIKQYSLSTNELLKCRWDQYKKNIGQRVQVPFEFPQNRDLHFNNSRIQFMQSRSIYRYSEHRLKLKPGPGVDYYGQIPIPQELLMKRGNVEKEGKIVKTERKRKGSKVVQKKKDLKQN